MKDPAHLATLRTYPCVMSDAHNAGAFPSGWERIPFRVCEGPVEAHHETGAGLALKASDHRAFPLCRRHHQDFHAARGVFRDWDKAQRKAWQAAMVERFKPIDEVFLP